MKVAGILCFAVALCWAVAAVAGPFSATLLGIGPEDEIEQPYVYDVSRTHRCIAKERIQTIPETDQQPATDLWIQDIRGGREVLIIDQLTVIEAVFSADGQTLAILKNEGGLDLLSIDNLRPIGKTIDSVAGGLVWSRSGSSLLFARFEPDGVGTDLWLLQKPGGIPKQLTDAPGVDDRAIWLPGHKRIVFVSGRSGLASLWTMSADGTAQTQVTNKGLRSGSGAPPEGFVPVPMNLEGVGWEGNHTATYGVEGWQWRVNLETGVAAKTGRVEP